MPGVDIARYYPYLLWSGTALGVLAVVYLLLLRIVRDRRSR